ncbi:TPA: exo-alpha-sialidase, partial [Legionella pneumophila]|nr:hypothetical protein [Legionella pneumophila]HAU1999032.1 hypothetical protein [Legionella pneumophila]HAU2137588.1 hypothetical protein [Legionella pneumophila]
MKFLIVKLLRQLLVDIYFYSFFILVLLLGTYIYSIEQTTNPFLVPSPTPILNPPIFIKETLPMPQGIHLAHAPTITAIDDQHLLVMYFAGSKEGASDVAIYSSKYDVSTYQWSLPTIVLDRKSLSKASHQYIRKLGNPVLYNQNGTIQFFVVATSFAGWAASKIYQFESTDQGRSFHFKSALILSPFFNLSTLVRTVPQALTDGGFLLPVYHEMESKYPLLLLFDKQGVYQGSTKMSKSKGLLQPTLIAISPSKGLAAFRNQKGYKQKMLVQYCNEGGSSCLKQQETNIDNHDSSVNLFYFYGDVYLVHNTANNNGDRGSLTLSLMNQNNSSFTPILSLDSSKKARVSYPTAIINGDIVDIVYDKNLNKIKHIRFNKRYLKQL